MKKIFAYTSAGLLLLTSCTNCIGNEKKQQTIAEKTAKIQKKESKISQQKTDLSKAKIIGTTNKSALSYAPGEEMIFRFKLDLAGQKTDGLFLKWERKGDDGKPVQRGMAPAASELVVKTSLAKPGFVYVPVFLCDAKGKLVRQEYLNWKKQKTRRFVCFYAGAGVQVETLTDCGEPKDFDQFWAKQKARLAKVPFQGKVELTKVKTVNQCDIYAVSIPCAGPRPVTGFLSVPAGAKPKSLPAKITFHGYGASPQQAPNGADRKYISLNINAHGQKLLQSNDYYKKFFASIRTPKYSYAFNPDENRNPETAFFNGMVLRVMRAMEYLKTRPEWNGKELIAAGGSQGGLQTMWAAALDQDVTEAYPSITWCCDLAGQSRKGRLHGSWRIPYVPGIDYYDPVFMAKRIKKAEVFITRAGLGDYTCPPSGLAISYKNIASPKKQIRWVQGSNHGFVPEKSEIIIWKTK